MSIGVGELAEIRREAERFLPDLCTIRRYAAPTQGAQGETPGSPTDVTGVPCRVANGGLSDQERVIAAQLTGIVDWIVSLSWNTDVRQADQILWTDPGGAVRTLDVKSTGERSMMVQRRVLCSESR